MKRMFPMILLFALLLCVPVRADELTLDAPSALLMEKQTGTVLFAKDEHTPREPASVTKVMTLLLTMEAIDSGALSYDDTVTGSAHAASMGGSQIWLKEGEQMRVEDLIKAVCIVSGNDAAVVLAEHLAGSEDAFVERMNARAQELGIAPDFYKTKDIHIHFPEGAIPKDGPSAGIAIATAVLSALTGQAVHRDVAMTGEITLRGRVLAIGGLREKTMGALRAGVHTVILPKENEKDLDEIDPLVREKLRFVPVETVDAVFAEALVLPEKCTAAAHESYLPPVQESAHSALRAGEMS